MLPTAISCRYTHCPATWLLPDKFDWMSVELHVRDLRLPALVDFDFPHSNCPQSAAATQQDPLPKTCSLFCLGSCCLVFPGENNHIDQQPRKPSNSVFTGARSHLTQPRSLILQRIHIIPHLGSAYLLTHQPTTRAPLSHGCHQPVRGPLLREQTIEEQPGSLSPLKL